MSDVEPIRAMVVALASGLVDDPASVTASVREDRDREVIELEVPDGQRGQVIGRGGRIAHALRTVTSAAGRSRDVRVALDIVD